MSTALAKKNIISNNISQSNELTEAAYYLPLKAKRVLWMCLKQTYSRKDSEDHLSPMFSLRVRDYQEIFGVNAQQASKDMKSGIADLLKASVTFYPKESDYEELSMPWLSITGLRSGRGVWDLELNRHLIPYMAGLTSQFTTYSLLDCAKLKNPRMIRLYESLCQYRATGIWVTSFQFLAERYELPYSQRNNTAEMKRGFLNPSVKKINACTPLTNKISDDEAGKNIFTIVTKG